jgi:DNA-binding NarL/FixJ family response regulator
MADLLATGIIAPSADIRDLLRAQVNATGLASVEMESDQYCTVYGDRITRKFIEAQPDVILIDMQDPQAGLQSTSILHAALPDAWLFVSSESTDPQLIIESMRAGAREFLPKPIPPRTLAQAISRFRTENGGQAFLHHFGERRIRRDFARDQSRDIARRCAEGPRSPG